MIVGSYDQNTNRSTTCTSHGHDTTAFYFNLNQDFSVIHIDVTNKSGGGAKCNYGHIAAYQIVKLSLF